MVKNRAAKDAARKLKASTGITYPRALERSRLNGKAHAAFPALKFGTKGGESLRWQAGPGAVLEISGSSGSGKSSLINLLAAQAAETIETYIIDLDKGGADYGTFPNSTVITDEAKVLQLCAALEAAPRPVIVLADECLTTVYGSVHREGVLPAIQRFAGFGAAVITATQFAEPWHDGSSRILIGHTVERQRRSFLGLSGLTSTSPQGGHYRQAGSSAARKFIPSGRSGHDEEYPTIDNLGLPASVRSFTDATPGLYLFTGYFGSGRTISMTAVLNEMWKRSSARTVLIEETAEIDVPDDKRLRRRESGTIRLAAHITEAQQECDILVLGEIGEGSTMLAALKAAADGKAVYATIHAGTGSELTRRILGMVGQEHASEALELLPRALRGVLHHSWAMDGAHPRFRAEMDETAMIILSKW